MIVCGTESHFTNFFRFRSTHCADNIDVFICPECNSEVADPGFQPAKPWWRRRRWESSRPTPVCGRGHKLRSQIIGENTELPLPWAFLRGLFACSLGLLLGILNDMRSSGRSFLGFSHISVLVVTVSAAVFGIIAFGHAWTWLGVRGPARRLAPRAMGSALGYLVPSAGMGIALYLNWIVPIEAVCGEQVRRLVDLTSVL